MEAQQTIVHGGICGPHMNGHMLAKKLLGMGYYWSTMESDCTELCQIDANKINAPPNELHKLTTPWPFAVLAWMDGDLLFPLPQKTSKETNCVIVAIDYFTKWVEAASVAHVTAKNTLLRFFQKDIICRPP